MQIFIIRRFSFLTSRQRASFEGNLVDLLATAVDTYIALLIYKVQCIVREDN